MHTSKAELQVEAIGDYEGAMTDTDGDLRIAFEKMPANFPPDPHALFAGLENDHCQCPHWGYVLKGSFRVTYEDGTSEVVREGEAYYMRPGHLFQTIDAAELVEFSPIDEHDRTVAQIVANVEAGALDAAPATA